MPADNKNIFCDSDDERHFRARKRDNFYNYSRIFEDFSSIIYAVKLAYSKMYSGL